MLRILLFILLTTSLFSKEIIAVLDLEQIGLTQQEAKILTQRLTTKLIAIDKYQVVERTNMDKILKEQKFQHSGCTDSECAVEIGQLLNTDYIVIGSVSKFGTMYSLDSRLIDVAQGKGLISAEFSIIGEIEMLMSSGITSIARQLCEMEGVTEIVTETDKQKQVPSKKQINLISREESVKDIDDNTYKIVRIGKQLWMAENLKVTHYKNGKIIPHVYDKSKWNKLKAGAYSIYDNKSFNAETYGNLYNWYAVADERGICPAGWHVPSSYEWMELEMYLGMSQYEANETGWRGTEEGGKLKEEGIAHWNSPNYGATNESGFTGLPAGYRHYNQGYYNYKGYWGMFWSSSEKDSIAAWNQILRYDYSSISKYSSEKSYGYSVRCLAD